MAVGLVASLARPGGNVTGVAELTSVTAEKRLELLRDLLPSARRVAVVVGKRAPESAANRLNEAAYAKFGMSATAFPVGDPRDVFDAVYEASRRGMQALVLVSPNTFVDDVDRLMRIAIERKLPVIADDAYVVAEGALASLGNDWREQDRSMWYFVDRILRGARPAELPVQQPSRFVTAINTTTAKALGVPITQQLLQRANRVFD